MHWLYYWLCFSASDVCQSQNDACQAENEAVSSDIACSETAAIIGGVVAMVLIITITTALTVIVIVVLLLRSRSGNYKNRYIAATVCLHVI